MLARWRLTMEEELPEVVEELERLGGLRLGALDTLPHALTGGPRPGDERLRGMAARRPLVEGALAAVAARTPGVTVRRGVAAAGLVTELGTAGPPHVAGVRTAAGETVATDLVVDAMGRRSALPVMLRAAGVAPGDEERDERGFAYYGRHFRTSDGSRPPVSYSVRAFEGLTLLAIPADADVWAWVLVRPRATGRCGRCATRRCGTARSRSSRASRRNGRPASRSRTCR
ncbi:hypothetical protein BJF78_14130 [Pseudonocardia sp. CNS-139]|nr:hypothetical protein BJF78_14130 [Pseudonocardia sp. CNS-139]